MEKNPSGGVPVFDGEILVCEDNEINQHFIKTQLVKTGLNVVITSDGRECVDLVQNRMKSGAAPFDLIFMDIQMPVMDGLEASNILTQAGVKTPIVALTSNVTPEDQKLYAAHGMNNSLNKPFTMEELLDCLGRFLTPSERREPVNRNSDAERQAEEEKQRSKLYSSFVRRNQNTYDNLSAALDAGDIKLAHRLAHTLKGLAGLMEKHELMEAARVVELCLAGGTAESLEAVMLETVRDELNKVLTELAPYLQDAESNQPVTNWDKTTARELLDKLEPLLQNDNAASKRFAEDLRSIPGTAELIIQLEDYEFENALTALAALRKTLDL